MITRIEVWSKVVDTRALVRKNLLTSHGFKNVTNVELADVYHIAKTIPPKQLNLIFSLLVNPVSQTATTGPNLSKKLFSWAVEISYLPGVTDNVASTVKESIVDVLKGFFIDGVSVSTSQLMLIYGRLRMPEIKRITDLLYNPLIQRARISNHKSYLSGDKNDSFVGQVLLQPMPAVDNVNLDISDSELILIGKEGIKNTDGTRRGPLSLDLQSMKAIQNYFHKLNRDPTDVELESLAQTWSEHCKHTIMNSPIDDIPEGLFRRYIKRATQEIMRKKKSHFAKASRDKDFCVSVFSDNSGAIAFNSKYLLTHKVETHNSPSALDPFGGAITGILGVNRDALGFGLGAKPIANTYGFCVGDLKDAVNIYRDKNQTQPMLSPRRILDGIASGVNAGGNCSGIPTPQGFLYTDNCYKGKPLVFVGTVGIIPRGKRGIRYFEKKARKGDFIVMIGGRVGLDGIHGATFSSEALQSGSPVSAVQIGDPITQKKFTDALVREARDQGLYHSITDNGAGGLSCSVGEMAKESGGCEVWLEKVPLKYSGLSPWQIWISESQERMTLAVPPDKWKPLNLLFKTRGVESTVIGKFTASGKCVVKYEERIVMDLDMEFLHYGLPLKQLISNYSLPKQKEPKRNNEQNYTGVVLSLLSRPPITGFSFLSSQYDHEVQSTSVLKPLQGRGRVNGDASVLRPLQLDKQGFVLTQGLYPNYSGIDTYHMAACAIDTAIRQCIAVGADPDRLALLDNFCWSSPGDPQRLGELKRAAQACYDYSKVYEVPFISGKDSMYNDFRGYDNFGKPLSISVRPTLLISAIGIVSDVTQVVSLDFKMPGDLIYILGETHDELGGSQYFKYLGSKNGKYLSGNQVPKVNTKKNNRIYRVFYDCIRDNLIASAQSVGWGGIGISLFKSAIGGLLGIDVSLKNLPGSAASAESVLFSESQGRIVISVAAQNQKRFENKAMRIPHLLLGKVGGKNYISINGLSGKSIVHCSLDQVGKAYGTLKNF